MLLVVLFALFALFALLALLAAQAQTGSCIEVNVFLFFLEVTNLYLGHFISQPFSLPLNYFYCDIFFPPPRRFDTEA